MSSHSHTHTPHIYPQTCSHTVTNTLTHTSIHTHSHTPHIYPQTCSHTVTYTLTHTYIHTHSHTHTHFSTSGEVPDGFRVSLAGEGNQTQFSGRWERFCSRLFLTYDLNRTAPALGTLAPLVSPNFTLWWVPKKTLPGPGEAKNTCFVTCGDAGKDWGQEGKWVIENEMVGWHHWLKGHEFEQTLDDGKGQGSLACCSSWGHKESDTT